MAPEVERAWMDAIVSALRYYACLSETEEAEAALYARTLARETLDEAERRRRLVARDG